MNTTIKKIHGRQILDSRGIPTVEVDVFLEDGTVGVASVPSGLSRGEHEAHELRDEIHDFYAGKSVWQAVSCINKNISDTLRGLDARQQHRIDEAMLELDGTQNKRDLGANAILGVSLACARVAANALQIPLFQYLGGIYATQLPQPMVNVLNGGAHADNPLTIQEFMLVPQNFRSFAESLRAICETFYTLKKLLREQNLSVNVGDEGGFAPNISSHEAVFDLLLNAIRTAGYIPGEQIRLAIDVAASELYNDGRYHMNEKSYSSTELVQLYETWCENYPICSIEDGLAQDDWDGWGLLNNSLGEKIHIVGDDLFCTNEERLREGIQKNAANSILIKPNQVGTLTETFNTVRHAKKHGFRIIVSHRSGETEDCFISDLAVGVQADYIKTGSVTRGERTAKYNRLLRIEQLLAESRTQTEEEVLENV